jgi:3-oxoacyl-[acyl-carrier protein] reductase
LRLENKVAIITGAANGIGLEVANLFANEGARVVLADYDEAAGSKEAEQLRAKGKDVLFVQVNVADRESVDLMVNKTITAYGLIDILINNAGITRDGRLTKPSTEDFQRVLDVNLTGVSQCTQAVVPHMIEQGSRIGNTVMKWGIGYEKCSDYFGG